VERDHTQKLAEFDLESKDLGEYVARAQAGFMVDVATLEAQNLKLSDELSELQ